MLSVGHKTQGPASHYQNKTKTALKSKCKNPEIITYPSKAKTNNTITANFLKYADITRAHT